MIDKLYKYYIKTKFCEYDLNDVKGLEKFYITTKKHGLSIIHLSDIKKEAIETHFIGRALNNTDRRNAEYILGDNFNGTINPVQCFIEQEKGAVV